MPPPRIVSAAPDRRRDRGLLVLGLAVLVVGFGTFVPALVFVALGLLWWGRPLGVGALFGLAVALAAWINVGGPVAHRVSAPSTPTASPWMP